MATLGASWPDDLERSSLSDLLDELGPQAPTLVQQWTARDLAAHLVLREHDFLAAPGLVVPGWWSELAQRRQRTLALREFAWLTATIRQGPPLGFFRIPWVRRGPNLNEFFVHHEDLRRANGYAPRACERAMNEALWRNVRMGAPYLARRIRGAGLVLQWAGTARTVIVRRAEPTARITGLPGELLLYLFGRREEACVEMTGLKPAIEAVRSGRLGMRASTPIRPQCSSSVCMSFSEDRSVSDRESRSGGAVAATIWGAFGGVSGRQRRG